MKSKIFSYLFIFASLIALYQFVSANNMVKDKNGKIENLEKDITQMQDSIQKLNIKVLDVQYFTLDNNDDALAYYDHLKLEQPTRYIEDKLLETNEQKGDNPLVPYEGMEGDFKINKIKTLNHKWIIADFSDGQYWGEVLLKYELSADFTLLDHLLYTRIN